MKRLITALAASAFLIPAAAANMPAVPAPTAAQMRAIVNWTNLQSALDDLLKEDQQVQAVNHVLEQRLDATNAKLNAVNAYWKAWCGLWPGCAIPAKPMAARRPGMKGKPNAR